MSADILRWRSEELHLLSTFFTLHYQLVREETNQAATFLSLSPRLHQSLPHLYLSIFLAICRQLWLISSRLCLLFCVIKSEQQKVDCPSVLQNKSITPLSHSCTADNALRLSEGTTSWHFSTCPNLLLFINSDLFPLPSNFAILFFLLFILLFQ